MPPITWENVNRTLDTRALEVAQNSANAAIQGINGIFQKTEATDAANWGQGTKNNTAKFLDELHKPRSPEELASLQKSGFLDQMRQQFGAQVDQTAIRNAEDTRMGTLQQRGLTEIDYNNRIVDQADAPVRDAIGVQIANRNFAGADALLAGNPMLRNQAALAQAAASAKQADLTEGRNVASHLSALETAKATRAHQAEQDRIARAKLVLEGANLTEQRIARQAAASNTGLNAKTNHLKAVADLIGEQTKASQDIIKNTPLAERLNEGNMDSVIKHMTSTFGNNANYGTALTEKLNTLKKEMPSIPVSIIKDAIDIQKNSMNSMLWGNDGNATNVVNIIKDQMKDPRLMTQLAYADEQIAKARGTYAGSSLNQPKSDPVDATPSLPPLLKFNPPSENKNGGLTYATPGSFNISANHGIAAPTDMPKGALDVSIPDGDTIAVKGANGKTMKFRFNAVDAQETGKTKDGKTTPGQQFSEEARSFVTNAFKQGKVDVRISSNKPDAHGRQVADVYVDGENLNEALVRKGLVTVMSVSGGMGPSQKAHYEKLQAQAMKDSLGIFGTMNNGKAVTGAAYRMFEDNLY